METRLGSIACRYERPEPQKFAWPIVLLPELFTTGYHLAVMIGYLATIGWEVYAPDLRAAADGPGRPGLGRIDFAGLTALATEALESLDRPAIVMGHGMGGLIALKLAEVARPKAAVALAPLIPGVSNSLISGWSKLPARLRGRPLRPPRGRTLFEFLLDVESFQRPAMVQALTADAAQAAHEVAAGDVQFVSRPDLPPRLLIAGEVDTFASPDNVTAFARSIGAAAIIAKGRGHWLISGRGLERTIGEAHRFLVRSLGEELLLLFPEQWKSGPEEKEGSD